MTIEVAAIPWYSSAKIYENFRASAVDAEDFFPTFREWLEAAICHEREAERRGVPVVRIRMRMQTFAQFSRNSGKTNDGPGRTAFANHQADKFLGNNGETNLNQTTGQSRI